MMDIMMLRDYCLSKNNAEESCPFGPDIIVFKVNGKIFAICSITDDMGVNLKCDPYRAEELREEWPEVIIPGYHMNKKHWNTVGWSVPSALMCELIDHSYDLVSGGGKKKRGAKV
jgi:predicted DNA-binding protein (MmcQ/YjbR family)